MANPQERTSQGCQLSPAVTAEQLSTLLEEGRRRTGRQSLPPGSALA